VKRSVILWAAILLSLPVISRLALKTGNGTALAAAAASTNASQSSDDETERDHSKSRLNACSPPNHVTSSIEETAWRLWVAATCPVNPDQYPYVVWENWIEQDQLFPLDPAKGLKVPNAQLNQPAPPVRCTPVRSHWPKTLA
jgi:hypothetical protein